MTPQEKETRILATDQKIYARLFEAIIENNIRKMHAVLKKYRFDEIDTNLALSAAVELNNLSATKLLLKHGADRLTKDSCGRIVLHKAHSKQMVDLLLQQNTMEQIDAKDHCGNTPLEHMRTKRLNSESQFEALDAVLKHASVESKNRFLNTPTTNNLRIEYPNNHFRQMNYHRGIRKGFSR